MILLALEFLVFLFLLTRLGNSGQQYAFSMTEVSEDGSYYVSTEASLTPGVYQLLLNYHADSDMTNVVDIVSDSAPYQSIYTNTTVLYAGQNHTDYVFWVNQPVSDLKVQVTYGGQGMLQVQDGLIVKTNLLERQHLMLWLVFACILNGILFFFQKKEKSVRKTILMLVLIIAGSSLPLFTDYMLTGADMTFHLLRIEGIKDALLSGQFPVRMHPNWLQGHGYAAGIFYCDFFLYIPAILRIFGFTVQGAYKSYKLLVNIATCLVAYGSFKKMLKDDRLAMLGSFLYTFQVIRLIYIYGVDGVGQFTAMIFFPLVAYGFYRIFAMDPEETEYKYSFIPLTIGLSGIILSHVLSCVMTAFFAFLFCIICIKKVFKPKIFLELCKTVFACVLLNAWYLVPFLDYTVSMDFAVTKGAATMKQIQTWGMYIPQLFEPFPFGGQYGAHNGPGGIVGETSYGIGLGLDIGLIFILCCVCIWGRKLNKGCKICLGFGLLSMVMSTLYFPWDKLAKTSGAAKQLIATLQFPNRMLVVGIVFLIMAVLFMLQDMKEQTVLSTTAILGMVCGTLLTAVFFNNTILFESSGLFRIYDETCMGNSYISGGEYVLLDTDVDKLTYKMPVCGEGVQVSSYIKDGCHVVMDVATQPGTGYDVPEHEKTNSGESNSEELNFENSGTTVEKTILQNAETYVELPLLYYKGYCAIGEAGQHLELVCGDNNVIRVLLPTGYQGSIDVDFDGFWYWRVSEALSLATLLVILALARKSRRGILLQK